MENVVRMRAFARTVESGSFSAAGRQTGVAPSSVSRHIAELEEELGARLFHRTTRKLSLTESGSLYYEHVLRILAAIDDAKLALSSLDGAPSGVLRVTAPGPIARQLTARVLPGFLEQYPAIQVLWLVSDHLVDLVEQRLDVALRLGRLQDSSLTARTIGNSRRIVCASPDYVARHGKPACPADLAAHSCVLFREHPGRNRWEFAGPEGSVGVDVGGAIISNHVDTLISAAVAGIGICMLPDWNMGMELAEGKLIELLPDYELIPSSTPVNAVFPYQHQVPPKLRVFIDYLVEHAAEIMVLPGR
ncbi:MAG: LysR family transcriptional regulator [Alphaproteobacteria bacterium]|jgi:DNA-binding transcriptional LysR family regulator|nr:LysR family transcriptional regulator [Alphaproteobacteria bacterium]